MITKTEIERRSKILLLIGLLILSFYGMNSYAQCTAVNNAFNAGEQIEYELYFNWKFVWTKAGKAVLKTSNTTYHSTPAYQVDLLSVSNKKVDFFFKMRDTLTSIISKQLTPYYFRKAAEEGKRYTVDEAWFAYKNGVTKVTQTRKHKNGKVNHNYYEDSRCVYDMLSILMQARSYDPSNYTVGQRIHFPMTTGKRVEEQTLIYRGRTVFKSDNGISYRCLIFSLVEKENKKEKEVITFFITDDDNHIPVRLDLFLNIGSAKAFLTNVKGNRHPMTAIVQK